ncbi:unnamed protein product, partial [Dicrocoelium dendriticum]
MAAAFPRGASFEHKDYDGLAPVCWPAQNYFYESLLHAGRSDATHQWTVLQIERSDPQPAVKCWCFFWDEGDPSIGDRCRLLSTHRCSLWAGRQWC